MKRALYFGMFTVVPAVLFFSFFPKQTPQSDLGDIRYSLIEPNLFKELNPGWELMAGQPIEANWDLYQLLSGRGLLDKHEYSILRNNLPDARGVFVRGMNAERNDSHGDLETTREVGKFQDDVVGPHSHPINMRTGYMLSLDAPISETVIFVGNRQPWGTPPAFGSLTATENQTRISETRPKNISLYIYVKVKN